MGRQVQRLLIDKRRVKGLLGLQIVVGIKGVLGFQGLNKGFWGIVKLLYRRNYTSIDFWLQLSRSRVIRFGISAIGLSMRGVIRIQSFMNECKHRRIGTDRIRWGGYVYQSLRDCHVRLRVHGIRVQLCIYSVCVDVSYIHMYMRAYTYVYKYIHTILYI